MGNSKGSVKPDLTGISIAVFVSGQGRGSNMRAIITGCADGSIDGHVSVVIGTRKDAPAIASAESLGVRTVIISPRKYPDDHQYGSRLIEVLQDNKTDLICLAGYMRAIPNNVIDRYRGAILNVHPSLLPLFGGQGMYGAHVHSAVIESGMKVSGATVHLVDETYDTGQIIRQDCVPVFDSDTASSLAERVLKVEHKIYVEAITQFARDFKSKPA